MTLATLQRRPRSAQRRSSSSHERVEILDVMRTLSHLLRVKWQRGGDCIGFPDGLEDERRRAVQSREIILQ